MTAKFFGQYLIDQNLISGFDLVRVLKFQEKNNLSFGQLAIQMGIMTAEQVAEVHAEQKNQDLSFGELASRKGFITVEQSGTVLRVQRKKHMPLGRVLVALGVMEQGQLDQHLQVFEQQLKASTADDIAVLAGVNCHPVGKYFIDSYCKVLRRMTELPFHLGAGRPYDLQGRDYPVVVSVAVSGAVDCEFAFALSDKSRILLSSSLLEEDLFLPSLNQQNQTLIGLAERVGIHVMTKAAAAGDTLAAGKACLYDSHLDEVFDFDNIDLCVPLYLPDGDVVQLMLSFPHP